MGMDLGFISFGAPVNPPEHFQNRYVRRGEFYSLWLEASTLSKRRCSCPPEKHEYGCTDLELWRPAPSAFPALRKKMEDVAMEPIFFEMLDWLESRPDVYLDFS